MEPSRGCVLVSVALILLMDSFMEVSAKKGVLNPRISFKPPSLDQVNYKTTYACEGKILHINCTEGVIHLIRANYGRFSISICNDHGNLEWRVNCMSYHSFLIMQERCNLKPNCSINVSSSTFQDPCPGTVKYLEVQFHCGSGASGESAMPSPTTTISSMPPLFKPLPTVNATLHFHENKSFIIPFLPATVSSRASALPTFSPIARHPSTPAVHLFPTLAVFPEKSSTTGHVRQEIKWPLAVTFPPRPPTVGTTAIFSEENYCPPTFSRGINWTWTFAGDTAVIKCPDGALGVAKWHCKSKVAKWATESPDLKQCRSLWLESVRERMQNDVPIIGITTELSLMSFSKPLFSEDLKEIAELIQQVLYKGVNSMENFLDMWHRYHVLRELFQSLVHTLSNLLDDKQKPAWNDLSPLEKRSVISSLLGGVEESALLLAETSNEDASFSIVRSNVLCSLQVIKVKSPKTSSIIRFPTVEDIDSEVDGVYWSAMQDSLQLPAQALQEYFRNGLVKLVFAAFNNVGDYLRPGSIILHHPRDHPDENITRIVNSRVISASLERTGNSRLFQPVIITLKHLKEDNVTNPVCVFWDFHSREWSARGCWVEANNRTHTVCACDHLTNFAVVMEVKPSVGSTPDVEVLNLVISIGCIVALVCLLITVVVLVVLRNVTRESATTHRNMFLCLFISELVFVGGVNQTGNPIACAVVAGMLQYFFLAAFSWMFFECYQQYVVLIETCDVSNVRARWYYYAVSYIAPGIIVGVSAVVDPSSYGTNKYCWLQADNYFVFSFVGPAVGIVFGGMVFLCISLCVFCHQSSITTAIKGKEEAKISTLKYCIRRSIFLTLTVSLTWTSGLLYINKETVFLACSFVVLNVAQGIYILVLYCLLNEEVKQGLQIFLRNQNLLPSCRHPNQKDQEPQISSQLPSSGTAAAAAAAAGEHIPQQYWNLMRERRTRTSPKFTTPGPLSTIVISSPEGDTEGAVTMNIKSCNKKWDAVTNASWGHRAYSSGEEGRDDSSSATLPVDYKTSRQHRFNQQYCHFPAGSDPNGQFVDHIYESIDDEPNVVDYQQQGFTPLQQFPPAENYYGDHSDLSQHSSSSYGYDQRPLLIAGPQARQPSSQQSFCVSRDYSGSPSSNGRLPKSDTKYVSQSRKYRQREKVNPERTFSNSPPVYDGCSSDTMSGTPNYSAKDSDPEGWGPSLPDLLPCSVDGAVVLAVLDGDRVVTRLQQEDMQCQPKCKLSTYC